MENIKSNKTFKAYLVMNLYPYEEMYEVKADPDYCGDSVEELKDKINCYDKEIRNLNFKIDKVVDSLAWWIPIKKIRDKFRGKFLI